MLNKMLYAQVYEVQLMVILTCTHCPFLLFEYFFITFYSTVILRHTNHAKWHLNIKLSCSGHFLWETSHCYILSVYNLESLKKYHISPPGKPISVVATKDTTLYGIKMSERFSNLVKE